MDNISKESGAHSKGQARTDGVEEGVEVKLSGMDRLGKLQEKTSELDGNRLSSTWCLEIQVDMPREETFHDIL